MSKADARVALARAETELWRAEANLMLLLHGSHPVGIEEVRAAANEVVRLAQAVGDVRREYETC